MHDEVVATTRHSDRRTRASDFQAQFMRYRRDYQLAALGRTECQQLDWRLHYREPFWDHLLRRQEELALRQ